MATGWTPINAPPQRDEPLDDEDLEEMLSEDFDEDFDENQAPAPGSGAIDDVDWNAIYYTQAQAQPAGGEQEERALNAGRHIIPPVAVEPQAVEPQAVQPQAAEPPNSLPAYVRSPRTNRFLRAELDRVQDRGNWRFAKLIAAQTGNKRYVSLYEDEHGNLIRRVVVKMEELPHRPFAEWNRQREYGVQVELTRLGNPHIASCFGSAVRTYAPGRVMNIGYLEFLSGQSLWDLMARYVSRGKQVPEGFIWVIFRATAEAMYAWTTGTNLPFERPKRISEEARRTDDQIPVLPGWPKYLNLDIKLENICLGMPHKGFEAFPNPKVIDFGHLFEYDERDDGINSGTRGYMPPEVIVPPELALKIKHGQYTSDEYDRIIKLSIRSEIFCLGLTILNLMSLKEKPWKQGHAAQVYDSPVNSYSKGLIELVEECVRLDLDGGTTDRRPQLMDLLLRTREGFEKWERSTVPMKGRTREELGEIGEIDMPQLWEEEYITWYSKRFGEGGGGQSGDGDDNDDDDDNNNNDNAGPRRKRLRTQSPSKEAHEQKRQRLILRLRPEGQQPAGQQRHSHEQQNQHGQPPVASPPRPANAAANAAGKRKNQPVQPQAPTPSPRRLRKRKSPIQANNAAKAGRKAAAPKAAAPKAAGPEVAAPEAAPPEAAGRKAAARKPAARKPAARKPAARKPAAAKAAPKPAAPKAAAAKRKDQAAPAKAKTPSPRRLRERKPVQYKF